MTITELDTEFRPKQDLDEVIPLFSEQTAEMQAFKDEVAGVVRLLPGVELVQPKRLELTAGIAPPNPVQTAIDHAKYPTTSPAIMREAWRQLAVEDLES